MEKKIFVVSLILFYIILEGSAVKKGAGRVCVIGAGIGGLTSARYFKEENLNFTVFEATKYIGGTWRYEHLVGKDEFGQPIHTSMYKHLRTNIPKVTMELPGLPIPEEIPSYPNWELYYNYLKSYSKHFDLENSIKFLHAVTSVRRLENKWKVKYKRIPAGDENEEHFDFVVIATGHNSKPHMPNISGENLFKGSIIHSHDYREPDPYKQRRVLVIGAGPSGTDIGIDVASISKTLVHSHHSNIHNRGLYPSHYIFKPNVREFNETGVIFVDGTYEEIDDVIYCTGYEYDFPFLDKSSGLEVKPNGVMPLYKYMVNINQPTMFVMGAVVRVCVPVALDAQARYLTALIKGNFSLPTTEIMMGDWQRQYDDIIHNGQPLSHLHLLDDKEDQYYADLTDEAGIFRVKPVISRIRSCDSKSKKQNVNTYREYSYKIIDDYTFTRTVEKRNE